MKTLIFPNTSNELLRVNIRDIIYVEADGNYCHMHMKGGCEQDLWFNKKHFTDIVEEQMSDEMPIFIEVGRSYIINRMYIYSINPIKGKLSLYGSGCEQIISLDVSQAALGKLRDYIQSIDELNEYKL